MTDYSPIFLVGMPGCGKTTLGRALAKALERDFIDLDHYIEGRYCRSVSTLFATKGEQGFRDIEQRMLHEVGEMEQVVIACGGGTPCFFDNMDYMLAKGTVMHLCATPVRLHQRLCRYRARRPAIANMNDAQIAEYINSVMSARVPFYTRAQITVESSALESRECIARTVDHCIKLLTDINKDN